MKVTVRTLDSQSHEFYIESDEITVKEFKEMIHPKVNIDVDKQRIIFRGKVLHDDKKLKEYGVDNCVVHLVERAPPISRSQASAGTNVPSTSTTTGNASNVYVGTLSSTDDLNGVAQHLVDSLISQFGAGNVSTSQMGNSLNVNVNVRAHNERQDVQNRLGTARRFFAHAEHLLQHMVEPSTQHASPCSEHAPENLDSSVSMETLSSSSTATPSGDPLNPRQTPNENSQTTQENGQENETNPQLLGGIYSQLLHMYEHLLPSLQRYEHLLHNPQATDRTAQDDLLPDQIAEIFHDLSHAFHAMSDLSMNFNSPSPQTLMCYPQMSPIGFPALPMPQVHMTPSPAGPTNITSTTSSTTTPAHAQSNFLGQSNQRTPVAVAAISTVVQIPAGISVSRSAPRSTMTSSSSTTPLLGTNASIGSFPTPTSFQPLPIPGRTSIQMGVIQGSPNMFSGLGSRPRAVHVNIGGNSFGGSQRPNLPMNFQNIMQNFMQNVGGLPGHPTNVSTQNNPTASNVSTSSTSAAPTTAAPTTTANVPSTGRPGCTGHRHRHYHSHRHYPSRPNQTDASSQHRPHPHHHHHNQDGSVIHPDSLLPCQSFHFGPTFHQQVRNPGNGNQQSHVVAEVSSIVIDEVSSENRDEAATSTTNATNSNSFAESSGNAAEMNAISNILNGMFGNMSYMQSETPASSSQANVPLSGMLDSDNMEIDDNSPLVRSNVLQGVQQMFQTIMGASAQQPESGSERQTLREFVRQNFGLTESGSDDFVADFIDTLADNLSLQDLIGLFFGQSYEPWNRLHTPLRRLMEDHFNDNLPLTEASVPDLAEKMAVYMNDVNSQIVSQLTVQSDIDLNVTLKKIDQEHFAKLLRLLLADESTFGLSLRDWYVDYAAWNFGILDHAVSGGADRYLAALFDAPSIRQMFQDMTPSLRQITLQTFITRVRTAIAGRQLTSSQLNSALIKCRRKTSPPRENPCKGSDDSRAAKRVKKNDKVDVNEVWEEKNPGGSSGESSDREDSPPSPEDWHSRIPNDWLVVINRDAERQRNMPPQRPYSDAYINGLPPKRRQTMTQHSQEADRVDVTECLKATIKRTDVKKNGDGEKLKQDVEEADVQAMFDTTLRHDIRQRLQEDQDYRPKQHPNAEKYFMRNEHKK